MAAKKKAPRASSSARGTKKPTAKAAKARSSVKKAPQRRGAAGKATAKRPAASKAMGRKPAGASKAVRAGTKRPQVKAKRPSVRPRRPAKAQLPPKASLPENPEALALARAIARVALDKKASDVVIIDTRLRGAAVGYDYVVLATGDSDRQLEAISTAVDEQLRPQGRRAASVEASADWVLANFHDVVAHFFTPDARGTYDLEGLWSDAPRVPVA